MHSSVNRKPQIVGIICLVCEKGYNLFVHIVKMNAASHKLNSSTIYEPKDRALFVERMFAQISSRYDLLNTISSFNQHGKWRRIAVRLVGAKAGDHCLDVCTGTGDLAIELTNTIMPRGCVIGVDFCEPMMRIGLKKLKDNRSHFMAGNAQNIPCPSNSFDVVTIGFGIRNVASRERGLAEMYRVLQPGGKIAVLEASRPDSGFLRPLVEIYLYKVVPKLGALFGLKSAYTYLSDSVAEFLSKVELATMLESVGFVNVAVHPMNFGTVCVHIGHKPSIEVQSTGGLT